MVPALVWTEPEKARKAANTTSQPALAGIAVRGATLASGAVGFVR